MKKRTVIWLAVAFVVLLGAYLVAANWTAIHEHFWPTEYGPYQGDGTSYIYNLGSMDDITRIDWRIDDQTYSITRNADGGYDAEDGSELEQQTIRDELLKNLYTIKASHTLGEVNKADYDLEEPWMEYTIWGGGTDATKPMPGKEAEHHTIHFGTYNPLTETFYATMDDDDTVYLLYNKLTTHFGAYEVYAPVTAAPENPDVVSITVTKDGETHTYLPSFHEDGTFYSTVFSWYEEQNGRAQAVNVDAVDALYSIYNNFSWTGLEASNVTDLEPYGLDGENPIRLDIVYRYQTTQKDKQGNDTVVLKDEEWHLLIGGKKDDKQHYGMYEGTGVVDYIKDESIEALLNFNPAAMPYHVAVVPEWQTLRSIDISLSDGRNCLLEIVPDESGAVSYRIQGREVEKEDVRSVFLSFFNMPVDGIKEDASLKQSDAVLRIHLSRDRQTYKEMDLYLIPYNGSLYAVDFAGEQRYLVSKRVVDGIVSAVDEALAKVQ